MRLGIQIRREEATNYVQIQSNDYEKIEEALEEQLNLNCGRWGFNPSNEQRLRYALAKLFDNHSEFYDYFGFDAGVEHGPTGTNFDTGGWRQFLEDAFDTRYAKYIKDEDDLQLFTDAIAKKLRDTLEEYDDNLLSDDEKFAAKSSVTVDAEPSGTLNDPELMDEGVFVGNDKAFKIRVSEVEDAETLDDIKNEVEENTKQVYENQVDARVDTLKERNNRLEQKIDEERKEMLVKGIKMVGSLDDWKVEGDYLKYTKTVNMETVKKDGQDNPRELTEEAQEKFYIEGLKIPIRKEIKKVRYDDAFHPHALGYGTCTGNFRAEMGEDGLRDVIDQLKHGDLHNTSHTDAERDLKDNWDEYIQTETVETEDGEEEQTEVTEEVWSAE